MELEIVEDKKTNAADWKMYCQQLALLPGS